MTAPTELSEVLVTWLHRVSSVETPQSSVVAFNVGLFETEDGFTAYLVGAKHFDAEDASWACDEAFTPKERYVPLPTRRGEVTWRTALGLVADAVRTFIESPDGARTFLGKAQAVTVGFDDGDLVRVK